MDGNQKVVIGKGVKRISLQRYLATKVVLLPDKVSKEDLLGLFENQLWCERKALTDKTFKERFGSSLEVLSSLLKDANVSKGLPTRSVRKLSKQFLASLDGFLVPKRNFPQWRQRFGSVVQLNFQQPLGTPNKEIPPKGYIGKGYGDKGTAQNEATDASPSWQEVARADHNLNKLREQIADEEREPLQRVKLARELIQERERYNANMDRGRGRLPEEPTAKAKRR